MKVFKLQSVLISPHIWSALTWGVMNVWFVQFRKCHDLRDSAGRSFSCKNGNISTENSYFQHFQIEFCPKFLHSAAWHHNQLCFDLDLIYEIHFRLFYPQFHSDNMIECISILLQAEIIPLKGFTYFLFPSDHPLLVGVL